MQTFRIIRALRSIRIIYFAMPKLLKKVSLTILAFVILSTTVLSGFAPALQIEAASPPSPWYNQGLPEWYNKVYNSGDTTEIFGERYTAAQVDWVVWSVITWLPTKILGPDVVACGLSQDLINCIPKMFNRLTEILKGLKIIGDSNSSGPFVAGSVNFIEFLFSDRPISGISYFKDIGRRFNLIPEASAQTGFGFATALDPVRSMWSGARNISYSLLVVVIIAMAFMIMFRVKISPQAVITVQSALPNVIVAIILITFSYAIAGFLIDLMYVVIQLVSMLSIQMLPSTTPITNPGTIFGWLTIGSAGANIGVPGIFVQLFLYVWLWSSAFFIVGIMSLGPYFGVPFFLFFAALLLFIFLILSLWWGLKIVWMLLKTYATILLLTIFAPFQILIGTLVPTMGFSRWLKEFISNLAVFVVVGLLFSLAWIFLLQSVALALKSVGPQTIVDAFFTLIGSIPFLNFFTGPIYSAINAAITPANYWPPLLNVGGPKGASILFLGTSFVIFTIIPKTTELIKALISGQPFAYGTAIGEAFGPVRTGAGLGLQYGVSSYEAGLAKVWGAKGLKPPPVPLIQVLRALGLVK